MQRATPPVAKYSSSRSNSMEEMILETFKISPHLTEATETSFPYFEHLEILCRKISKGDSQEREPTAAPTKELSSIIQKAMLLFTIVAWANSEIAVLKIIKMEGYLSLLLQIDCLFFQTLPIIIRY
jgi:hypothetical protein